jgi:hypothetical protein
MTSTHALPVYTITSPTLYGIAEIVPATEIIHPSLADGAAG